MRKFKMRKAWKRKSLKSGVKRIWRRRTKKRSKSIKFGRRFS